MSILIQSQLERGILIVDDDPPICEVLQEMLQSQGYSQVLTASDGTEAVTLLASEASHIYLVLLDLIMPQMSGFHVIEHLSNVHVYPVGIIVVTGYGDEEKRKRFYQLGTDTVMTLDFLQKPIQTAELVAKVKRTLDYIHRKRMGHISLAAEEVHKRLDKIEDMLAPTVEISHLRKTLDQISQKQRGFLAEIGMDILRAILIALAFLAFLWFGVGDFLRAVISGHN